MTSKEVEILAAILFRVAYDLEVSLFSVLDKQPRYESNEQTIERARDYIERCYRRLNYSVPV